MAAINAKVTILCECGVQFHVSNLDRVVACQECNQVYSVNLTITKAFD